MFFKNNSSKSEDQYSDNLKRLKEEIKRADAIIVGAGAGLSTAAGYTYSGERFDRWFSDFAHQCGFQDMYSGGFYPYQTLEEYWAFWSRNIWLNRYTSTPKPVYEDLYELVREKDYFVLTTNVDHCFQKAGFDKQRLFYTQGDYGLWQCSDPCHDETYDNKEAVRKMVEAQGFTIGEQGELLLPEGVTPAMAIPSELVPKCPKCGKPMTMNLRIDHTFVQDEGWYAANNRFASFLSHHGVSGSFGFVEGNAIARGQKNQHILYLELGIGANTPGIVKYPFWKAVYENKNAVYGCLNFGQAYAPKEIQSRSICIDADTAQVLQDLR